MLVIIFKYFLDVLFSKKKICKSNDESLSYNMEDLYNIVHKLFYYDEAGFFRRAVSRGAQKKDSIAGTLNKTTGYYQIKIDNTYYQLNRLIFLYHHGWLPEIVDHFDRNILNNKISNLKPSTRSLNAVNSKTKNKLGIAGVVWCKTKNKYIASARYKGKQVCLLTTSDFDEAVCARLTFDLCMGYDKIKYNLESLIYVKKMLTPVQISV